ncbi:MAG: phosphoribosylformylglycinamidine cyclo-ligase [Verrucomicrobiales bacterium]
MTHQKLTYQGAGVDTKAAAALIGDIATLVKSTQRHRRLANAFGLFAAAYDLSGYSQPVIVTGCDGVGTKLELLLEHDLLETAGKDLVAMNVNDVLTTGADPIMFLDYIGIGVLDKRKIRRLIAGMAEWCAACRCILAGGETAEMPGIVPDHVIELAGFAIGAAEKKELIDISQVKPGDVMVGFPSAGFHANGWTLVRQCLRALGRKVSRSEVRYLLAPTRLYHNEVWALRRKKVRVHAMAHITGGGLPENLERLLGNHGADLEIPPWKPGAIPKILALCDPDSIIQTFNLGWGWVAIVDRRDIKKALACGEGTRVIGEVVSTRGVRISIV